ncbi:MAG: hypothetical protein K1X67_16115 [Fimbriimonadaceae bacterium]|nr:hypothetical protein [Fimbriimonadaceae bacterium]
MIQSSPNPEQGKAPSPHTNPIALAMWSSALAMFILSIPALSVVVFLRRKFGCRQIKLWMAALNFFLLFFVLSPSFSFRLTPLRLFALLTTGFAIYHSRQAWTRFWEGKLWHSMSDGEPFLRSVASGASERVLKQLIEPGAVIGAALACLLLSYRSVTPFLAGFYMLGLWLVFAAIAHGLYEAMLYEQRLHAYIDQIDARIESTAMLEMNKLYDQSAKAETVSDTGKPSAVSTNTEPPAAPPDLETTIGYPVIYAPEVQQMISDAREREERARGQRFTANA